MMFKCAQCDGQSPKDAPAHRLVVVERPRIYLNEDGSPRGLGWEIEREILICQTCKQRNLDLSGMDTARLAQADRSAS